jgi:hypothetical protein
MEGMDDLQPVLVLKEASPDTQTRQKARYERCGNISESKQGS